MNPRVKQLWIEALRSGKFKQAQGRLKTENGYCCLGVLCELHRREVGGTEWKRYSSEEGKYIYDGHIMDLPWSVVSWADLDQSDPRIIDAFIGDVYLHSEKMSGLNDSGETFGTIATLIEEKL